MLKTTPGEYIHAHSHTHNHAEYKHAHTHGSIDPEITSSERGIWAVKWSFVGLMITVTVQAIVFWISGSVALLADLIHNIGDAVTAIPLGIAFLMARWKPNQRFSYGYGRAEDLAGVAIVALVLLSALITGYESINRFLHPQSLEHLGALSIAAVIGFIGNEVVALFRIRVGKEIGSVALVADGYHARADGLVSLSVGLSALGLWLGYPWADPVIGLLITLVLLQIVWDASKTIFTRLLDGVEPEIINEVHHAVSHVLAVKGIDSIQARWLGRKLHAQVSIYVEPSLSVAEGTAIATQVKNQIQKHTPYLAEVNVQIQADNFSSKVP
ncbi:MAG: cation transporter [Symploca sp. SIO3C6]|nr:cation transporter [Symploca sp. SIO3C6]NET04569.1 cation transporter [Symploca sp. SIO2B6]